MLDGSLLLDIKPYLPDFDVFEATRTGWFKNRSKE
jgi:tRNA (Thr-GGU) A37 N-methylase